MRLRRGDGASWIWTPQTLGVRNPTSSSSLPRIQRWPVGRTSIAFVMLVTDVDCWRANGQSPSLNDRSQGGLLSSFLALLFQREDSSCFSSNSPYHSSVPASLGLLESVLTPSLQLSSHIYFIEKIRLSRPLPIPVFRSNYWIILSSCSSPICKSSMHTRNFISERVKLSIYCLST